MTAPATLTRDQVGAAWKKLTPREQEFASCAAHPFYFGTRYVKTFDETDGQSKLYPAYPYLKDKVIPQILKPGNAFWPKSQRMIITISFCMVDLWLWLFQEGENIYWTSKNDRSTDNGGENSDWNSIAGKIRYMFDRLPGWIREMALGRDLHSRGLWKKGSIRNPKNGNIIKTEAPTSSAAIGEGYTRARVDEAANVVHLKTIHANLTMSCRGMRHYISYPVGRNNFFGEMNFTPGHFDFRRVEVLWDENPNYTKDWRKEQEKRLTGFFIAQRLDVSFEESAIGKVWDNFDKNQHVGGCEFLDDYPIFLWWDFGFVDSTSVGFVQYSETGFRGDPLVKLRVFDWLEINFSDYVQVSEKLRDKLKGYGVDPKNTNRIQGYGDPQVKASTIATGVTLQEYYRTEGFMIESADAHQTVVVLNTIDTWLKGGRILISDRDECEPLINALQFWEWPKDRQGNPKPGTTQPNHDVFSHAGKAAEYGFLMTCMTGMDQGVAIKKYITQSTKVKESTRSTLHRIDDV